MRLARIADAEVIAALSREQIEHGLPWRWTAERIRRSIRHAGTNVAVAEQGDDLCGFGIMQYGDEEAHLLLFAVAPAWRRQGVGAALLGWLEDVARTAGIQRVLLECRRENGGGRNFYGALGYEERVIVRRMYEGVEDGIRFEKTLIPSSPAT